MFEPVRGGTRGGQAEFKWTDVSADKDREVPFSSFLSYCNALTACIRTISATVSMRQQGDGRRTRMYIGTTGISPKPRSKKQKKSGK
jgi:hypothetical protein